MFFKKVRICLMICLCNALICQASNEKREAEIAAEIEKTKDVGHVMWLDTKKEKFLSLYTDTTQNNRQGIIILVHDMGGNPNQQSIIKPFRTFFPEHHWATLSIQMPLADEGASRQDYAVLFPDAKLRLLAAIDFAKLKKAEKIFIIGDGLGGVIASYTLADKSKSVDGLVVIRLPLITQDVQIGQPSDYLSQLTLPILDIYDAQSTNAILQSAKQREDLPKKHKNYRQLPLENQGRSYLADDDLLLKRIYSWLGKITANPSPTSSLP